MPIGISKGLEKYFDTLQTTDGMEFAECVRSPSSEFTIAWRDSDGLDTGGARSRGKGVFWLFQGSQEVFKGKMERPNDGAVADDGTFILCDWLFTDALASIFYAFNRSGQVLIRKRFKAKLNNAAVSPDGAYAICHTAHNPSSRHGNLLTLFDLRAKAEVWHLHPPFWPGGYEFNIARGDVSIVLGYRPTSCIWKACVFNLSSAVPGDHQPSVLPLVASP